LRSSTAKTTAARLCLCTALAACAVQDAGGGLEPRDVDGVEEASEGLDDLSAQCSLSSAGVMSLALNSGDVALIGRSSTSASATVQVNGYECGPASASALRQIAVTEASASTGDQTVILDYSNGPLPAGRSGAVGVDVDLGTETTADALKIIGSSGNDTYVFGATGVTVNSDALADIRVAHVEQYLATMGGGNDSFSAAGSAATGAAFAQAVEIYGGDGNDSIRGGAAADIYHGGLGNDVLVGGDAPDGGDTMNGDDGVDVADYSARTAAVTVTVDGQANDGGSGGSEGDDVAVDVETVKGGGGDDSLTGGAGSQTISGGPGADTLAGGAGDDILNGDAGDDRFDAGSGADGADVLNGGAGIDTADYSARQMAITVAIDAQAGDGQLGENDRVATDVENLLGGDGNDRLTGSSAANLLVGGAGDDVLGGGDGNDTLRGNDGDDSMSGGNGNDVLDAEEAPHGGDTMMGGAGVDLVTYAGRTTGVAIAMDGSTPGGESGEGDVVGTDVEDLRGGTGDDHLIGNALDNVLEGGAGTDTIEGGAGDDTIDGDLGSDVIDCGPGDADVLLDTTVGSESACEA